MKISLMSLGCKVNQAEIASIEQALLKKGHEVVALKERPDYCVINTCTVTAKSDYQSRQLIRRAQRSGARILVTGCYSELNKETVASMEGVEQVIENTNKDKLISILNPSNEGNTLIPAKSRTRKTIKVQDGCNFSCSYCLIWKARGRSRSIKPEKVISAVEKTVDEGTREIVLTGIHLGLYGQDFNDPVPLSALLEMILSKTSIERIRLSSLEIGEIDERLIALLGDKRVCDHLHIPLQSGDDVVLKDMRRNYDSSFFRRKIDDIAERFSGIALGTDIIAGFPSESDEAFARSYSLARDLPFTYMHVFPYSRRPKTEAASMADSVGGRNRRLRAGTLRELAEQKKRDYLLRQTGRTLDVLIEDRVPGGMWRGTSRNYVKVLIESTTCQRGSIVPVRIAGLKENCLVGKPVIM